MSRMTKHHDSSRTVDRHKQQTQTIRLNRSPIATCYTDPPQHVLTSPYQRNNGIPITAHITCTSTNHINCYYCHNLLQHFQIHYIGTTTF